MRRKEKRNLLEKGFGDDGVNAAGDAGNLLYVLWRHGSHAAFFRAGYFLLSMQIFSPSAPECIPCLLDFRGFFLLSVCLPGCLRGGNLVQFTGLWTRHSIVEKSIL